MVAGDLLDRGMKAKCPIICFPIHRGRVILTVRARSDSGARADADGAASQRSK